MYVQHEPPAPHTSEVQGGRYGGGGMGGGSCRLSGNCREMCRFRHPPDNSGKGIQRCAAHLIVWEQSGGLQNVTIPTLNQLLHLGNVDTDSRWWLRSSIRNRYCRR